MLNCYQLPSNQSLKIYFKVFLTFGSARRRCPRRGRGITAYSRRAVERDLSAGTKLCPSDRAEK
jgi:hypothetical protein